MWPILLDMTRDECRGILRRLELEAYSNLISSFRAQGSLSDSKVKILEDLRKVLHISIDRHRAEARRVSNDEQLCTIAEALYGPNTNYEWNKEGRRPFPLLPRSAAYTALDVVAEEANELAVKQNLQLPHPSETRRPNTTPSEIDANKNVVLKDPVADKVNLKRTLSSNKDNSSMPYNKKRGDIQQSTQMLPPNTTHLLQNPIHTNTRIQQLYHTHSKTQSRHKKANQSKRGKRRTSLGRVDKPERKIKEKLMATPPVKVEYDSVLKAINIEVPSSNASPLQSPTQTVMSFSGIGDCLPNFTPQIATSKKDIASNLNRLNLNTSQNLSTTYHITSGIDTNILKNQNLSHTMVKPMQPSIKMIPSINFKIPSNILQKSLSGKVIDGTTLPIGSKINVQLQQNPQTTKSVIPTPTTMSSLNLNPLLNSPPISISSTSSNEPTIKILTAQPTPHVSKIAVDSSLHGNISKITKVTQKINQSGSNKLNKVQIISQQVIQNPIKTKIGVTAPTIKIAPQNNIQLKTLQANKNQIKLIPSTAGIGKVVIKTATPTHKLSNITPIKATPSTSTTSLASPTITTTALSNFTNIQKVQLMPVKGNEGGGKSNVILMQKINQATNTVRNVKISNEMNKLISNTKNLVTSNKGTQFNQNNVIVLGFTEENDKIINKSFVKNSIITEDTPVDIVPEISNDLIINGSLNSPKSYFGTSKKNDNIVPKTVETITDWENEVDQANLKNSPPKSHQQEKTISRGYNEGLENDTVEELNDMIVEDHDTEIIQINENCKMEEDTLGEKLLYDLSHTDDEDDFIEEDHTYEEEEYEELDETEQYEQTFEKNVNNNSGNIFNSTRLVSTDGRYKNLIEKHQSKKASKKVEDVENLMIEMHELDESSNRCYRTMSFNELLNADKTIVSSDIREITNGNTGSE